MFDIGFLELVLVSVIGLLVLGPERLPVAIRTVSLYVGKIRRSFNGIRAEIERELKADEIRQELHNQSVMQELRRTEQELRRGMGVDSPLADDEPGPSEKHEPGDGSPDTGTSVNHGADGQAQASGNPESDDTGAARSAKS